MGYTEFLMTGLTAFGAAGSFIFAAVMETRDVMRDDLSAHK